MSVDGVLAAIDACLDDYAVSDDAMRWAPDEPDTTSRHPGNWYGWDSTNERLALTRGHMTRDGGSVYTIIDETHVWDARRVEEASYALAPWQHEYTYRMVSQHGEGTMFQIWTPPTAYVVRDQREAWARLEQASLYRRPVPLAETVFAASLPEPGDAPEDPPTLPAPVLLPSDGSHPVTLSESVQRTLDGVRRLPIGDAPTRRRNHR